MAAGQRGKAYDVSTLFSLFKDDFELHEIYMNAEDGNSFPEDEEKTCIRVSVSK
jgi:hypothetical protein